MSASDRMPRTLVWLEPEQVPLVRAVADQIELPIVAAGSPTRGRSREVAEALGGGREVEPVDDLRAALAATQSGAVWIAAAGFFGAESAGGADLEALRACRARGVKVASMEPIPASALELAAAGGAGGVADDPGAPELVRFIPRARLSRAVLEAAEVLSAFGPVRTVAFEGWSGRGEGTLGSRLLDAMDVVAWLLGEPETIDAAYMWPGKGVREVGALGAAGDGIAGSRGESGGSGGGGGAGGGGGLHLLPAETLRDLRGDMTLNCRFADGRGAGVVISDQAGRWNRSLMLVGPGGRIRVYDDGFEWVGPDGVRVDASRALGAARSDAIGSAAGGAAPGRNAGVVAEALERYFGGREGTVPPMDIRSVLTMTGAALLSAKTGEGESPATIARMAMLAG